MRRAVISMIVLGVITFGTILISTSDNNQVHAQVKAGAKRELPKVLLRPRDHVALASRDAAGIADPEVRKYVRYLSLYNVHPLDREAFIRAVNFACNSLSTQRVITHVEVVPGSEGSLLRLQIDFYGWTPQVWDSLGRKGSGPLRSVKKLDVPEMYFHEMVDNGKPQIIKKTKKVFKGYDQRYIPARPVYEDVTVEERVEGKGKELQHASWLVPQDIAALALAVETDFPIYRADWFIANALIAPAYYDFLGVKTLEDFQTLVRYRKRDEDLSIKGVVIDSNEVALHQRAARFIPTALGAYWETFDYFTSINDDDLLKNLLNSKRDAGEIIANLPNSLQAYLLVDGKDKVIDFADPNVAIDMNTSWKNKLVWSGISCMTCHVEGMKDVADEVRVLSRPPFALLARKKKDFKQVIEQFSTPIEEPVDTTKAIYKRSIFLATKGSTPQQNAAALQKIFITYHQKNLDLFDAALEVGASPAFIVDILGRTTGPDHTLTQLLAKRPVRRDQWEAAGFQQLSVLTLSAK